MRITESAAHYAISAYWLERMTPRRPISPEGLRRHQVSRLRAVLSHAQKHYPFYRTRLEKAGIDPDRFGDLDDIRKLPPLSREEYRDFSESPDTESARLASSTTFDRTSGSTGRPVTIYLSRAERARMAAKFFRALFTNGYDVRDKTFQICLPGEETIRNGWPRKIGILGGISVLCTDDPSIWIDAYMHTRPQILYANRSHLVRMALQAAEHDIALPRPKLCISGGETLDGISLRILSEAFGRGNLVQTYGTTEFGTIGFQTRAAPFFHLAHATNYFELETGPATEGAGGSILVTDLYPRPCPLIRYRLGDSIVFGLEHGIPVLRSLIGRENDFIRLGNGSLLGSPVFEMIMERRHGILQYRIVQSAPGELDVYFVARKCSDIEGLANGIAGDLKREICPDLRYRVRPVPRIEPDANGKLRALVCGVEKA
jgi:phenylacetate-CoA ligase